MVKRIAGRIDVHLDPNSVRGDPVLRDLFAVETVPEAARRWNVHQNTIRTAMTAGKLDCRLAGGTWLITVFSLIKVFGKPIEAPDLENVELSLPMWRKRSA